MRLSTLLLGSITLAMMGCSSTEAEPSGADENPLLADARSMTANGDGTFEVVCKDNTTHSKVTPADIAAGKICNGATLEPPAPSTWSTAKHRYEGAIFGATDDGHYALVNFKDVGFGKFDLLTYSLTESYGDPKDYPGGSWSSARVDARGSRVIMARPVSVAGSVELGVQIDLRDMNDPTFAKTILRPPTPGGGNLVFGDMNVCRDGRAGWQEAGKYIVVSTEGVIQQDSPRLQCPRNALDDLDAAPKRADRAFSENVVSECKAGSCTPVRTMPPGTEWVVFSRSGDWLAYRVNGFVYRDSLAGGSPKAITPADYVRNDRDGKLVAAASVYDIDADITVKLVAPVAKYSEVRHMPNGVSAFYFADSNYTKTVLISADNQSLVVDDSLPNFEEYRAGLGREDETAAPNWGPNIWLL